MITLAYYDAKLNVYQMMLGDESIADHDDRPHIVLDAEHTVSLFDGPWIVDLETNTLVKGHNDA